MKLEKSIKSICPKGMCLQKMICVLTRFFIFATAYKKSINFTIAEMKITVTASSRCWGSFANAAINAVVITLKSSVKL